MCRENNHQSPKDLHPRRSETCDTFDSAVTLAVSESHAGGLTSHCQLGTMSPELEKPRNPMGAEGRVRTGPSPRAIVLNRIPADRLADILDFAEDGIITVDVRQEI